MLRLTEIIAIRPVLNDLVVFKTEPMRLSDGESPSGRRECGINRSVLCVKDDRRDMTPVHRRINSDDIAFGGCDVNVIVQIGECGAQPLGQFLERFGTGAAC